jgi:hypothetical protein
MFQMTHRKRIAWGYLSHWYNQHPLPALAHLGAGSAAAASSLLVNGQPIDGDGIRHELARAGYRYVVWHKTLSGRQGQAKEDLAALRFIRATLGSAKPLVDSQMVRVYRIEPSVQPPSVSARLVGIWQLGPVGERWTVSPAVVAVASLRPQPATLRITLAALHDPQAPGGLGTVGRLDIKVRADFSTSARVEVGRPLDVPISLLAGEQSISFSLRAGNFQPIKYGHPDASTLSFAIQSIDLLVGDDARTPDTEPTATIPM